MTLRDLLREYPAMFYPQTWYADEPWLDTVIDTTQPMPTTWVHTGAVTKDPVTYLPTAGQFAWHYVQDPTHIIWQMYLWCAECDAQRQRVYVGTNGHGFEIHRHLHLTSRFGIAR